MNLFGALRSIAICPFAAICHTGMDIRTRASKSWHASCTHWFGEPRIKHHFHILSRLPLWDPSWNTSETSSRLSANRVCISGSYKKARPKRRMQTITSNWKLADIYIHPTNPFNVICSICSFNLSQGFGFVPCWNASIFLWQRGTTLWKRSEAFYHGRLGSPRAAVDFMGNKKWCPAMPSLPCWCSKMLQAWSTHHWDTVSTELGATRNVKPKTTNFFGMVYTNYSVFSLLSLCIRFNTLVQSCPI